MKKTYEPTRSYPKTLDLFLAHSGNSFTIREIGKFLSNFINELKIQYEIKE